MEHELQDFIKPGEFTFCSRCGNICRWTDRDFMCTRCLRHFNYYSRPELEEKEFKMAVQTDRAISDVLRKYRRDLAILRRGPCPTKEFCSTGIVHTVVTGIGCFLRWSLRCLGLTRLYGLVRGVKRRAN